MPDRDRDPRAAERQAARIARYHEGIAEALPDLDSPGIPAHCHRAQIAACALCDVDGYRAGQVCDHQEHSTAEGRQAAREAVRVALAKGEKR